MTELCFILSVVKSTHQLYLTLCTPQTIKYRAAKEEKGGKEKQPAGEGEFVVAEQRTKFLVKTFLFIWNLHTLLCPEIVNRGHISPWS